MILMHSVYHGYAPSPLLNHWVRVGERDIQYELRNNNDFVVPRCNYSSLENKPLFSFPDCWNKFDENKYIVNKFTFTVALDDFLLPPLPHPTIHPLNPYP
jgi:hypothetical protein